MLPQLNKYLYFSLVIKEREESLEPGRWNVNSLKIERLSLLLSDPLSAVDQCKIVKWPHSQWPCRVLSGVKGALSGERPFKKHRPDTFERCAISAIWLSQLQSRSALPARFNQINESDSHLPGINTIKSTFLRTCPEGRINLSFRCDIRYMMWFADLSNRFVSALFTN